MSWNDPDGDVANLSERQIAITIDDLPASDASVSSAASIIEVNSKLVSILHEHKVPAIGFVNEGKLYKWGEVDARIKSLSMWLDAGLELGNHTFDHVSLNRAGLKVFEEQIVQGEPVTRLLMSEYKMTLRYFRHPYLDTGRDLQTRREAEAFLANRGYRIAPITVCARDWTFADVYLDSMIRGDSALQQQIVASYLSHTDAVLTHYEQLSRQLVGYEVKQILLLHANWLHAWHLGEVLELLRNRGYKFITLDEALSDKAYSLPDTYVGEEGTSWLDHWAITRGQPRQGFPVPAWVQERYKALLGNNQQSTTNPLNGAMRKV